MNVSNIAYGLASKTDNCQKLLRGKDPFINLVGKLFPNASWKYYILSLILYFLLCFCSGILISISYANITPSFLSILEPQELIFAIFIYIIVIPLVWLLYFWQPKGVINTFTQLSRNGVIGKVKGKNETLEEFISDNAKFLNSKIALWLPIIIILVSLVIWNIQSNNASNPYFFGKTSIWWNLNTFYFWIIWEPLIFINFYMVIWIIFRQLIITTLFRKLCDNFEIKSRPFFPDKCCGFATVGDYIIRISLYIVLFSLWVSITTIFPMFFGQPASVKFETVIFASLYFPIIIILLIPPVWKIHKELEKIKQDTLEKNAKHIREILSESDCDEVIQKKEILDELIKRQKLMETELHTWPFRPIAIKSLGVSVFIPIMTTIIPIIADKW